ncbi:hypothetical protein [Actinokineospora pegani]|uniref:hypothetical protein n=1 Tax=Actinokineospora pegani TaxID=2654637 RepID=UPI0012EAEA7C|nr:hypothetical protein [Actinokineospora pegani]
MGFKTWVRAKPRWPKLVGAAVLLYAVYFGIGLLVRSALRGFDWHPDILIGSLIYGLTGPAVMVGVYWVLKRRCERKAGQDR